MQAHHWVMLLIVFALGGAIARVFPMPWQTVGLP